jgi:hypothetical protein
VDSNSLDLTATTIPSSISAPSTGTSNGNDAEALSAGFEEPIAWTRGDSLHPTAPSVHDDNLLPTSPSVHDDNVDHLNISPVCNNGGSLAMQPDTKGIDSLSCADKGENDKSASCPPKTSGSDPSSTIEVGSDDGDEDQPRPPDRRPALVVCQLQGTPRQIFQRAFDRMLDSIVDTPCLLDVNIAGANMDKKDALTLVSPRWYTDALINVLCRITQKRSNYCSISYQDAVTIEVHIPRVTQHGFAAKWRNHQSLVDWRTKLRSLEIGQPGSRWPCSRISSDCLSVPCA